MSEVEKIINELPEIILYKKTKAFLEITKGHVYYCTKHDNKGICNCVFVSILENDLLGNLRAALNWIQNDGSVHCV